MTSLIEAVKNQSGGFTPSSGPRVNVVAIMVLLLPTLLGGLLLWQTGNPLWLGVGAVVGIIAMQSPNVARQWEKAVVLLAPSTAVESMGLGGLLGAAAMRQEKLTGNETG